MIREKITLTAEQLEWLVKNFKHTKNDDIAAKLSISKTSLARLARKHGLKKTKQFQRKCQRNAADHAKASHIANGTYPKKGTPIPGYQKRCYKPGDSSWQRMTPRQVAQRKAQLSELTHKQWKEEKARVLFGLPQLTKRKLNGAPHRVYSQRWLLRKYGYIVNGYSAYYSEETKRSKAMESGKVRNPFRFFPVSELNAN